METVTKVRDEGVNSRREADAPVRVATSTFRAIAALIDLVPVGLATGALSMSWITTALEHTRASPWNLLDALVELLNHHPETVTGPLSVLSALFVLWSVAGTSRLGATPGQRVLGLTARTTSGAEISTIRAGIHASLAVLTTLLLGLGPMWSLADPERRTLYDRLAGVMLIRQP